MSPRILPRRLLSLAALPLLALPVGPARADLREYVKKPEPAYAWKRNGKTEHAQGTVHELHLVSQVWQGITWEHQLLVFVPRGVGPSATMLLWNQGGKAGADSMAMGMDLARKIQAPVAFLHGIPNQPLLGGKKEDTLIAETFVRYLETKDESWPLLFPMTKSLVKAMDALQAFSKDEWQKPVTGFVVSGASKRGWTTWLTAAADERVRGIAPLVIDTLNMKAQMPYQKECFGGYSEQIADYTSRGLVPMPETPAAQRLWRMVDPYSYRAQLKLPKFLIHGANDPYWTTDALNLYWDDLPGDKWVLYVPNAGHNLQQQGAGGKPDRSRAIDTLAVFARHCVKGEPLPRLSWRHDDAEGRLRLTVEADPPPVAARLWLAEAPTRDFRKAKWLEQPAAVEKGQVRGEVDRPAEGYRAFFGELEYERAGLRYRVSTQMRVAGRAKP